jgi:glucosamine--fructose-6-phosphate aminotransferase (isomerizing)
MDYRASIMRQPEALETSGTAVTAALDRIDVQALAKGSIAVTGIGASLHAAVAAAAHLRTRGGRAFAFCATDLLDSAIDASDALIALSASGRSRETVEAVRLRPQVLSYSISKETDNPLAEVVRSVVPIRSGEDGNPSTTSYTATLQAVGLLADRLARSQSPTVWPTLPALVQQTLTAVTKPAQQAADLLAGRVAIDFVGAGTTLGTAGEASLLVREAVRVPTAAHDTLHYLHGPMEPLDARMGLVVFGDGRECKLASDVAGFGCPTILITHRTDVAAEGNLTVIAVPATGNGLADAILHILPVQLMVASLADAAGLTGAGFRYRQTDTKLPAGGGR